MLGVTRSIAHLLLMPYDMILVCACTEGALAPGCAVHEYRT